MNTTYRLIAITEGEERISGYVTTLTLNPHDILIIRVDPAMPLEEAERAAAHLRTLLPDRPIIIVRGDVEFLRLEVAE